MDTSQGSVKLNDTDIPGAHLEEPFEAHNVVAYIGGYYVAVKESRVP